MASASEQNHNINLAFHKQMQTAVSQDNTRATDSVRYTDEDNYAHTHTLCINVCIFIMRLHCSLRSVSVVSLFELWLHYTWNV